MGTQETKEKIEKKLTELLAVTSIEVIDESFKHAGHASAGGGGHFIVHLVSEQFEGVSLLDRNRMVFDLFKEEIGHEIHALTVKAKTPLENT